MFTKETAFILGAGASWHYGYPTGEALVKKVIEKAGILLVYLDWSATNAHNILPNFLGVADAAAASPDEIRAHWQAAYAQCLELKAGLEQVNPLVIDYYLGWNPHLQTIGRLLIAWVILECEHIFQRDGGNVNHRELLINSPYGDERVRANDLDLKRYKDDWCRFVIHQIAINCEHSHDLFENKVRFITFNYDISLERSLYKGLRHIKRFLPEDVVKFCAGDRVLHVYGEVRENFTEEPSSLNWGGQGPALGPWLSDRKTSLDYIYNASEDIYVIDPDDKETNKDVIEKAVNAIDGAKYIYILGYGFDPNNSARLGLPKLLNYQRMKDQYVFFTNFGNINRVNKRVSNLFFGTANHFPPGGPQVEGSSGSYYYERSFREVYEALELDFDWFD
jgi:hypothetical protein